MTPTPTLRTADLDYDLPEGLVATRPCEPRDDARMLVVPRAGGPIEHRRVRDLPSFLRAGDAMVFNDTAVVPARLRGHRADTGGRIEGLFLGAGGGHGSWRLLLRPGRRLRPGVRIALETPDGRASPWALDLIERDGPDGAWRAAIEPSGTADEVLAAVGATPLPPYILRARVEHDEVVDDARDAAWYQTVFADRGHDADHDGSVAAPTAGLHFTPALLGAIDAAGATRHAVTLRVGPGTFRPVSAEDLSAHVMHEETYAVPPATLAMLAARRTTGASAPGRVLAVGTTAVRTLESLPDPLPAAGETYRASTDLMIAPPYRFRHVDGMLTNFHLPRSTLLALVAAMLGLERTMEVYAEAVRRGYRFYSYGDAMLIV